MSNDTVISVENLSKSYLIGHDGPQERYHSLRDTLVRHGKNYVRKAIDMARGRQIIQGDEVEEFWALKDVSFEVKRGEVLGIIGRNGAGKSTLLKILSRITEPTSGRVTLNGRVASLLEVGTGFHPELTGRENIFLNGAILGMSKVEIRKKFDEIVEFAGVEKFLDTPVKRYSSGMYVRLAFAVAAHLEPEILIIDEVLAVGDAEFQKKCLGKMQDVAKGGRTVLFVSHNMAAISKLCSRAMWLGQGSVLSNGNPLDIIEQYEIQSEPVDGVDWKSYQDENIGLKSISGAGVVRCGSPVNIEVDFQFNKSASVSGLAMVISNRSGVRVAILDFRNSLGGISGNPLLGFSIHVEMGNLPFVEGSYFIDWFIETNIFSQDVPTCWRMEVQPCENTLKFGAYDPKYRGFIELKSQTSISITPYSQNNDA